MICCGSVFQNFLLFCFNWKCLSLLDFHILKSAWAVRKDCLDYQRWLCEGTCPWQVFYENLCTAWETLAWVGALALLFQLGRPQAVAQPWGPAAHLPTCPPARPGWRFWLLLWSWPGFGCRGIWRENSGYGRCFSHSASQVKSEFKRNKLVFCPDDLDGGNSIVFAEMALSRLFLMEMSLVEGSRVGERSLWPVEMLDEIVSVEG